jgi:hypothetical protein
MESGEILLFLNEAAERLEFSQGNLFILLSIS